MKHQPPLKKYRIAHIAGGLTTGGVESMIYNYSAFLPRSREDYEFIYITYNLPDPQMKEKFETLGFSVYTVTRKTDNFFKSCFQVHQLFRKHHINIVHSHMTLMCFITSLLAMICGIRTRIAHSHLVLQPHGLKRVAATICKFLTKITSTHWLACGNEAGTFLYGSCAMRNGKAQVINNAVEPEHYTFNEIARTRLRDKHAIGNKLCIGHVGRFTSQKNHGFLIDAFAQVHQQNPQTVLLLIGDGPLWEQTRKKVNDLALTNAIIFAGSVQNVNEYYSAMDIFALPSLYEGLALVLVEVQYAGLPSLVSDQVTREINLCANMEYLPLNPSVWVDKLLAHESLPRHVDPKSIMSDAGYDIRTEAAKLAAIYAGKNIVPSMELPI